MDTLLRGFADELLKVATAYSVGSSSNTAQIKPLSVPSTGVRGTKLPQPPNAIKPTSAFLQAIPVQKMESPAKSTAPAWRRSPGARIKPTATPPPQPGTVKPARKGGRGRDVQKDPGVPYESGIGTIMRKSYEAVSRASQRAKSGKPILGKPPVTRSAGSDHNPRTVAIEPRRLDRKNTA